MVDPDCSKKTASYW